MAHVEDVTAEERNHDLFKLKVRAAAHALGRNPLTKITMIFLLGSLLLVGLSSQLRALEFAASELRQVALVAFLILVAETAVALWTSRHDLQLELSGRLDFVNADLSGLDLSRRYLRNRDFSNARLSNAVGIGTDLSGGVFDQTRLTRMTLRSAQLREADLRRAHGYRTDFTLADLRGADLRNGKFQHAVFRKALLAGARFDDSELHDADFTGAKIGEFDGRETSFHGAKVFRTRWGDIDPAGTIESEENRTDNSPASVVNRVFTSGRRPGPVMAAMVAVVVGASAFGIGLSVLGGGNTEANEQQQSVAGAPQQESGSSAAPEPAGPGLDRQYQFVLEGSGEVEVEIVGPNGSTTLKALLPLSYVALPGEQFDAVTATADAQLSCSTSLVSSLSASQSESLGTVASADGSVTCPLL